MNKPGQTVSLSVVTPAHNEEENLRALVEQIVAALDPVETDYEIVVVDDGSTDGTPELLRGLIQDYTQLRAIRMINTPPGRGHGQSAAFHAGFRASRGELIATLDADLQNDPADIPAMLETLMTTGSDVVQGDRSKNRRDHAGRKFGSMIGFIFRRLLLGDPTRDTGCSLRIMRREVALSLPLQYRGMHRFIPITARQLGYRIIETPVNHHPRAAGETKYRQSWRRAWPGLIDCFAVRWMHNRRRPVDYSRVESEITSEQSNQPARLSPQILDLKAEEIHV